MRKLTKLAAMPLLASAFFLTGCANIERAGGQAYIYNLPSDAPNSLSISNQYLTLDFLSGFGEIVLTQNQTGSQWRSSPYNAVNNQEATTVTRMHMLSLFALEYENQTGVGRNMDAHRFSIQNGNFRPVIIDDTTLEVNFTIGDVPQIFIMPMAVPESRMRYWTDQMEPNQRRQVEEAFRLYNFNNLRPADDVNELLEQFPTLQEENVFSLRDAVPDFLRERIEVIFYDLGYTMDDFYYDLSFFNLDSGLDTPMFNLTMIFELDGPDMVLTVPFDRLLHPVEHVPTRLTVMPFFGAGNPTYHTGYAFVPDGSGAILNFDSPRSNQLIYNNNVWGWDGAVHREIVIHNNVAPYPVFGTYKNGQTFLGIIEEGAAYASIRAELSGMSGPYTAVHPHFRLIHGASMNVAGRSDRPFIIHERSLPVEENIVIRYIFPTETQGYVGMAIAYRHYLQARYPWLNNRLETPLTAAVEILGAVETTQHFLGFPLERPLALTTYDRAAQMLRDFDQMGWTNVPVKMRGAHNNSIDHSVPNQVRLISQLGGRSSFNSLVNTANQLGFDFFLEGDFVHMRDISLFDGFNPTRDAARFVNRERAEGLGHSPIFFTEWGTTALFADPTTLARPSVTIDLVNSFVSSASNLGVNNIAFRTLASSLSGDFHENRHVTRETAMNMRADLLSELHENGTGIWLNHGFSYAMPFADIITGMPVTDQGFGVTDAAVPFYQIALHGLVQFAGAPLNLSEDYSYHLLRSIEAGASLFFSFMDAPTAVLHDTAYRRYFANEYGRWIDVANNLYQSHQANFGHLYNQLITDHQILADGVSVTVYEDGTRVYVNTSLADFNGHIHIPATRYVVVR